MKLGFFTGARSEYGLTKKLLKKLSDDSFFEVSIVVGGMHLLKEFGNTIDEIEKDGFPICERLEFFEEGIAPSFYHFSKAIELVSRALEKHRFDALFIVGDRFESYAAALAAHFTQTPIIHSGGGTITTGALDNIYRYNISNLASIHLATSLGNFQRLLSLPVVQKEKVFFTGSIAIDAIREFQKKPLAIQNFIKGLREKNFALVTLHPATTTNEPLSEILKKSTDYMLDKCLQVLITYPNNDPGSGPLLETIKAFKGKKDVFIIENLGATGYYAAMNDCLFVLGNSSSGVIEAPYFHKQVINIGDRQTGREKDTGITDVKAEWPLVKQALHKGFEGNWPLVKNQNIFGDGNVTEKIAKILKGVL